LWSIADLPSGTSAWFHPFLGMMLKTVMFLALVLTALALIPYGAHLFSLLNKIGVTREQYLVAQSVCSGWSVLSFVLIPAMLVNVALAVMLRGEADRACESCVAAMNDLEIVWPFDAGLAGRGLQLRP